jgi:hypothetical protein
VNLFVTGDSWTSCWPLEENLGTREFGWPALVAKHFGYNLIDKSRAASSNYRIFRKAFDAVNDPAINLVIVCLSSWIRCETGWSGKGKIYQHLPLDPESSKYFDEYFHGYLNYSQNLRMIAALQQSAKVNNKSCYFLDTFANNILREITYNDFKEILKVKQDVFDAMDDNCISSKFEKIMFLTGLIDFDNFISNKSYQEIIEDCLMDRGHPVADGHQKISQVIINFLESRNYGKTI